ncbi:MAG TPA: alpha/beta fold hydrolase [Acidimicrobiales bacterium]|nr:alpha/beta fold hydrolase [Acidimicrobiales bacterium]
MVVLVHGFAASADDPGVVRQAEALHATGLDVLCYDSRGHGDSDGLCTIGDLESHDVAATVAAVAAVVGSRDVPVIVLGASMGAIAALRFAAMTKEKLAGVVCVSSPSGWRPPRTARGVLAAGMTRTGLGRPLAARYLRVRIHARWANPEPPQALISRIAVPVALVQGERDRFIPSSAARELYEACRGARRLELVPDMGHAFDPAGLDAICAAVEWTLSGPADPIVEPGLVARSVGCSDARRSRRGHPRFIFRQ